MIDKLYEIVIKNDYNLYIENIKLFKEFYYRREEFFYYIDNDNRIVEIIKYMLLNDNKEIDNNLHINILNELLIKFKYNNISNSLLYKKGINKLIDNMKNYNSIKELISNNNYINKLDKVSLDMVKKYINSNIDIEILHIFINNLNNNFLSFDKEDILLIINTIENYNYDNMIIKNNDNDENIICNFVDNYCSNYLEIKKMCTTLDIKEDKLLNYLFFKNKINNELYYRLIVQKINNDFILEFFDYDLKLYKNIINNSNMNLFDKNSLLEIMFKKLLNEEYYIYLFNVYDIGKEYGNKEKYIDFILNDNPLLLNDELINFILKSNLENKYFLLNLNECKDKLKINQETLILLNKKIKRLCIREEVLLNKEEMSLKTTIDLISLMLNNNEYDEDKILYYFKNMVKEILKEYNIDIKVIYGENEHKNGYYNEDTNVLFININLIKKFIKEKNFDIFVTIFHEIRHVMQINVINKNKCENVKLIKDYILTKESSKYYKDNYYTNELEKDAKVFSLMLINLFIKEYFNDYYEKNEKKYEKKLLKYKKNNDNKKIFNNLEKYNNEIFDKIIELRLDLLNKYKNLLKNYKNTKIRQIKK